MVSDYLEQIKNEENGTRVRMPTAAMMTETTIIEKGVGIPAVTVGSEEIQEGNNTTSTEGLDYFSAQKVKIRRYILRK